MSHTTFVVVVVATIVMLHVEIRHARVLCPRCTAAVPLDAARKAQDQAATLRWTHRLCSGYSRWRFTADVALAAVIGAVVLLPVPLFVVSIAGVVAFGVQPVDAYLIRVHDPLQPWCPHCHWDDGDDCEDTDVPDPVPPSGVVARS